MHDWQSIELGSFRKNNISFNLKTILKDIENQMQEKARIKKLKLDFYATFAGQVDISRTVHLHTLLKDTLSKSSTKEMHKFVGDFDQFSHILPLHVIGDP